ncbi:MAG: conjugal transfer protein TraF [Acidobacteria bacterium]|nr:conjugal transfer protein TraF [Acidobacteriota bacterium]
MPAAAVRCVFTLCLLLAGAAATQAQTFDTVGTRAQGMGGAFVGVADDASAVYWNPAGLAGGAFFSLVLDGSTGRALPEGDPAAASRSGWLLGLSTPALGLSYYRLQASTVRETGSPEAAFRRESLTTHHAGATLVQSLTDRLAAGATLKVVRGLAAGADVPAGTPREALDEWDVAGRSGSRFDLDVGLMATGAMGRIGLVVRNVAEPAFRTGDGGELRLERQARAGASILLLQNWRLASDLDLTRQSGPFGEVREFALGAEGQPHRRLATRAGVRLNTAGDRGRTPSLSLGGSYAVLGGVQLDAQVTTGPDETFRGWGVAARVVF